MTIHASPRRRLDLVTSSDSLGKYRVERARRLRVALVNMPLSSSRFPSIQLGLLTALLRRLEIPVHAHYFNLEFGAEVGWEVADGLADFYKQCSLLGEWIFSRAAFESRAPTAETYVCAHEQPLRRICRNLGVSVADLIDLRERVAPDFVGRCSKRVDWSDIDVVGFSSVFQQNCAALALARRLKHQFPRIHVVFGGANFDDEMGLEYIRKIPWVDYAVIGDGEATFPALLEALAAGDYQPPLRGVAYKGPGGVVFHGRAAPTRALDDTPTPDYDDFFASAAQLDLPARVAGKVVALPFETSRGCWWGAKHHCTFCGMTAAQMAFRSKSHARVLDEIGTLASRYAVDELMSTDAILDQSYIEGVFEPLRRQRTDYSIFYEVKANLKRAQLRTLAEAGVRVVQPGIESLSTNVLQLMGKGVRGIQNVRFLKWACYYGMDVKWHILRGFPGECVADYEVQLQSLRLIPHLQPPGAHSHELRLDRFSPNFERAAELGFHNVRPWASYGHVYRDDLDLAKIAYSFDYDSVSTLPRSLISALDQQLGWWTKSWQGSERPWLRYRKAADHIVVLDGRDVERPRRHVLEGLAAGVFEACNETYRSPDQIRRSLGRGEDTTIREHLEELVDLGLVLREQEAHLSLALPLNPNW